MSDVRVTAATRLHRELSGWVVAGILTLTGAGMLWWTWGTWPDPWVDFGRELYTPWMLTRGKVLYRDLAWFNGPLSAYVNAAWFGIAGVSLRSLIVLNLAVLAGLTALIHALYRAIATPVAALLAATVFLVLFAFGEYADVGNYNYLTPYSHEIVHGLALSLLALWCLKQFVFTTRVRWLAGAGFAVGTTLLTKPEIFVATAAAIGSGLLLAGRGALLRGWRDVARFATAALVPVAVAVGLLSRALGTTVAVRSVLLPYRLASSGRIRSLTFYQMMSGVATPAESSEKLLLACLVGAALVAAAVFAAFRARRYRTEVTAAAVLALFAIALPNGRFITENAALPLPVFVGLMGAGLLNRMHREFTLTRHLSPSHIVTLTVIVFSWVLLLKVVLGVRLSRYGFVLAMPATLTSVVCLVDWVPAALERRHADGLLFRGLSLGALAVVVLVFTATHQRRIATERVAVGTGADRFVADARGVPLQRTVDDVRRRLGPGARLAVLPEGVMVNYLTRVPSSSEFVSFMPPEAAMFGEDSLLRSLQRDPPEFIAIVQRPIDEYGYSGFGQDFAPALAAWIRSHYHVDTSVPGVGDGGAFAVQLLRRSNA
jgi:hypothetical protein